MGIVKRAVPEQRPSEMVERWDDPDSPAVDVPIDLDAGVLESARQLAYDLRTARIYRGLSRAELASRARVGRQRVADIEDGRTWTTEAITVHRLATALDACLRVGGQFRLLEIVRRGGQETYASATAAHYRVGRPYKKPADLKLLTPYLRSRGQREREFVLSFDLLEDVLGGYLDGELRTPGMWKKGTKLGQYWQDTGVRPVEPPAEVEADENILFKRES